MVLRKLGWITCETIGEAFWSAESPLVTADDMHLVRALRGRGVEVQPLVWRRDDPLGVDCDACLVRTPWDYQEDAAGFLGWLEALSGTGMRVAHDPALLRWNIEKTYLAELGRRGARVIPTVYMDVDDPRSLVEVASEAGWSEVVLKPVIAAGGLDTYRLGVAEMEAFAPRYRALLAEKAMMLQPFLPEVLSKGEWSLIFFGGEYSHSVRKIPKGGEFRVQDKHGGRACAEEVDREVRDVAEKILDSVGQTLLYARVDGIVQEDGFTLIELEIFEPELFFRMDAGAADRFAEVLMRWWS
ncbi:hypothetical protein L6R29_18915 [Myxococcota bacterium]|nr:hypothetical protein [Myxococcota bacterium]